MTHLHLPWLELSIVIPLLGALLVSRTRDSDAARKWCLLFCTASFAFTIGGWLDFELLHVKVADDWGRLPFELFGRELFTIDQLSAPLLPLASMLFCLTAIATVRTKVRRFSFAWLLVSQGLVLATFSSKEPWLVIALLSVGVLPPYLEMRTRGRPTRVYLLHMGLFIVLLVTGWLFVEYEDGQRIHTMLAIVPLLLAVLVRSGIAPFHCWMTDLFEHATFGTALLFVSPMVGAYAAIRLVLPVAPDWVLHAMGLVSLVTAVYAAGMSLVQREARRFFCYLFLSHSALVLAGLEMVATPIGFTGSLCLWFSATLAMGGLGLTLRALEARCGRLSLADYQGLGEHTPNLALCFALTGFASVGFPGTLGFVGSELLVDGAVKEYAYIGVTVVIAAALNGIAVVHAYFLLFTGARRVSTVSLMISVRERFAVLSLAALILIGGLIPQPRVASRFQAAREILVERNKLLNPGKPAEQEETEEDMQEAALPWGPVLAEGRQ